jgi:hypothetical protein
LKGALGWFEWGEATLGQPLGRFPSDAQHFGQRRARLTLQALLQQFPLQQRHDEEGGTVGLIDLLDGHDMVVVQGRHRLRFAQEPRPHVRITDRLDHITLMATRRFNLGPSAS